MSESDKKDDLPDIEDFLEADSQSINGVISAIASALKDNNFCNCHIQLGEISVNASRKEKNSLIMNLGTFRIEMSDPDTTLNEKVKKVMYILRTINKLGFRPDKMVTESQHPVPEELYQ